MKPVLVWGLGIPAAMVLIGLAWLGAAAALVAAVLKAIMR